MKNMVTVSISQSPPPILTIFNPKPPLHHKPQNSSLCISSRHSSISILSPPKTKLYHTPPPHGSSKSNNIWRIPALHEYFSLSEATPVENSEQLVTGNEDGVSTIISVLLFIAFVGLSILTIGVTYIAVTDYLQKREREKFEKEETTAKQKKASNKKKVKARAGPRGFGQKIDEDNEDI